MAIAMPHHQHGHPPAPHRSEGPFPWTAIAHEGRWIVAAAGLGFGISFIGAQVLQLPRPWIILILVIAVSILSTSYAHTHRDIDLMSSIRRRWRWAIVRGVVLGAVLVVLVLPDDPSPTATELLLAFDVVWLGVVYGAAEALLVNVIPMMAGWRAFQGAGWTTSIRGKLAAGAFTTLANLLVTSSYHLGFPEFRGPEIAGPIGGNLLIAAGFVLAPNPIISIISHVILHVAAVLGGTDGPVQLPPHY